MQYLLHIDTSGDTGTIALAADGRPVAIRTNCDTRNQAAYINTMIQEVLEEAGIAIPQLSGVVICAGPGSYTGLRIGMATAKGICYVADIPLIAENKLTLLAYQALKAHPGYEQYMAVLLARENEYFSVVHNAEMELLSPPQHILTEELRKILIEYPSILIAGNVNPVKADISLPDNVYVVDNNILNIEIWAEYAFEQYKCNRTVSLATAEPFYLKQVYTHNSNKVN
jgi:tRNA threonylcarbamoyladenosine biosynthesis protein TsaB